MSAILASAADQCLSPQNFAMEIQNINLCIMIRDPNFNCICIKVSRVITSLQHFKIRLYAEKPLDSSKNDANSLGEIIFPPGSPLRKVVKTDN
jgi:hypothetical protein